MDVTAAMRTWRYCNRSNDPSSRRSSRLRVSLGKGDDDEEAEGSKGSSGAVQRSRKYASEHPPLSQVALLSVLLLLPMLLLLLLVLLVLLLVLLLVSVASWSWSCVAGAEETRLPRVG